MQEVQRQASVEDEIIHASSLPQPRPTSVSLSTSHIIARPYLAHGGSVYQGSNLLQVVHEQAVIQRFIAIM